jgi:hypothetical protein
MGLAGFAATGRVDDSCECIGSVPSRGSHGWWRSGAAWLQKNAARYGFFGAAAAGTSGDRPWHKPAKYGKIELCGC